MNFQLTFHTANFLFPFFEILSNPCPSLELKPEPIPLTQFSIYISFTISYFHHDHRPGMNKSIKQTEILSHLLISVICFYIRTIQFFSMKADLRRIILSLLLFSTIMAITSVTVAQVYAQSTHSEVDSTPIAAVIMMTTDDQGNPVFNPTTTTIKQGEELLVLNNLTEIHTFTNGNGTGDSMDGTIFSVQIAPGSFAEYLASNISPGNYSFYSENNHDLKGELVILP